jgi:hypothetical protein
MITLFENFNSEFKNYFISEVLNSLGIFEIIQINGKKATVKILYIYVDNNKGVRTFKGGREAYEKPLVTIRAKSLFMSDDLQECIDIIPTLNNSKKYNL